MKAKRIIACIISCILFMVCIPFTATAKVIEPEVVKTEKWTTSYYIDDDIDTLYPYIQCEADIYNDGTIKLYMWNTHEWSGFATVSHHATIVQSPPYSQASEEYSYYKKTPHSPNGQSYQTYPIKNDTDMAPDYTAFQNISYQSDKYTSNGLGGCCSIGSDWRLNPVQYYYSYSNRAKYSISSVYYCVYYGPLPNMTFQQVRQNHPCYTFTPAEDPTGTYEFRLFGHDITITPELLSGNIVATPSDNGYKTITYNNGTSAIRIKTDTDVSDIQKYIDELEAENAILRQENTELKNRINLLATGTYGDVTGDGAVTVEDSMWVLMYYTEHDVASKTSDTFLEWCTKRKSS